MDHSWQMRSSSSSDTMGGRHTTSSPLHEAVNGQAERTVGMVESILKGCAKKGKDLLTGLTPILSTPIADKLPSPAEILQGRKLTDAFPAPRSKYLVRRYDLHVAVVRHLLGDHQSKIEFYPDAHSGPDKKHLIEGQACHFKTARGDWISDLISDLDSNRSYMISTDRGHILCRDSKALGLVKQLKRNKAVMNIKT